MAGNPNAGKTTLFNALAGTRQKVANYPGVTVEQKEAPLTLPSGKTVQLIDLPGCYSLTARSPEEQVAHDVLFGRIPGQQAPTLVLCVIDASNLERNLYLATQILDQGIPLIIVLNMMDVARKKGIHVDPSRLETLLGCTVVPTVARRGTGLDEVLKKIDSLLKDGSCLSPEIPPFIDRLPEKLELPVQQLARCLSNGKPVDQRDRAQSLWFLLANIDGDEAVNLPERESQQVRQVLSDIHSTTSGLRKEESHSRYDYIAEILRRAEVRQEDHPHTPTERLDAVFLHAVFGPVLFILIFAFVFQSIFTWAAPAMEVIEQAFGRLAGFVESVLPESMFSDLLVNGIIAGVGNTVVFLPQILILFLFLGILEDTGYLARAAFIMDRLMSSVGLDGKAFIPLLSSFACAVPGIMATRTIPSRKDRLVTILIAPLMACSARLPVYTLVIGTVFTPDQKVFGFLNLGGLVMGFLYLMGIASAILIASIFKKTLFRSPKPVLLLELPTYKAPSLKNLLLLLWDRGLQFVTRAGTVILAVTVLLWGLLSFPRDPGTLAKYEKERMIITSQLEVSQEAKASEISRINGQEREELLEKSYGGRLGHFIEPVIEPLGFNWKVGVGLVASLAAREVFVSTLGVIYGISEDADENNQTLRQALHAELNPATGKPFLTARVGLSLLIFYVYACQCMSTIAIARRETNSWRWPAFMFAYMTLTAWVASFLVYSVGGWMGFD